MNTNSIEQQINDLINIISAARTVCHEAHTELANLIDHGAPTAKIIQLSAHKNK